MVAMEVSVMKWELCMTELRMGRSFDQERLLGEWVLCTEDRKPSERVSVF
jgi:hypothetical protein